MTVLDASPAAGAAQAQGVPAAAVQPEEAAASDAAEAAATAVAALRRQHGGPAQQLRGPKRHSAGEHSPSLSELNNSGGF